MVHNDWNAFEASSFLFPTVRRRLPTPTKRIRARLVGVGVFRIELNEPLGERFGDPGDVARV
jgi:hypothetical protein